MVNKILQIILQFLKKKLVDFVNKFYTLWDFIIIFLNKYFISTQMCLCIYIYIMYPLQCKNFYYFALIFSILLYFLFIIILTNTIKLIQKETTVLLKKPKDWNLVLIILPSFWFPVSIFINNYFKITEQIWTFMLTITTSYVWFFFGCFFSCYFTCAITYHLIMVGWHKQLYCWAIIHLVIIIWLYSLPYFVPNSFFAFAISNFIFNKARYIFIAWSGISYLIGWLWYRNYIQRAFSYYNSIPYTISIGNLFAMLILELYFGIFHFIDWPFIWVTYPAIIIWILVAGLNNFTCQMIDSTNNTFCRQIYLKFLQKIIYIYKISIWNTVQPFWKKQIFYFLRKMSLFYWIWLIQFLFFFFAYPLTNFKYWVLIVSFIMIFYCWLLCLCLFLIYFSTSFKISLLQNQQIYLVGLKKYIYLILPCFFIWLTALFICLL